MAEQLTSQPLKESTPSTTSTVTVDATDSQHTQEVPTLHLKLRKPRNDRKVQWTTETVDNEDMDKKKSKCCCIYKKQKAFGESSSEESSDDECDSCLGHTERKKKIHHHHHHDDPGAACPLTQNIPSAALAETEEDRDHGTTEPEPS